MDNLANNHAAMGAMPIVNGFLPIGGNMPMTNSTMPPANNNTTMGAMPMTNGMMPPANNNTTMGAMPMTNGTMPPVNNNTTMGAMPMTNGMMPPVNNNTTMGAMPMTNGMMPPVNNNTTIVPPSNNRGAAPDINNTKQVLTKRIQICDFVCAETALYLDTHPKDKAALAYYAKYLAMKKAACAEYAEKYGPMTQDAYIPGEDWKWVQNPWPWERSEG